MPVVKVEIAKVKVERHSTAKCQHCKKIFDIKSLESHIKAVEKEERIKKSAQILKDKKDAIAGCCQGGDPAQALPLAESGLYCAVIGWRRDPETDESSRHPERRLHKMNPG